MHKLKLDIERQRSRNPVRIDLIGIETFRFDEDLVRGLVGETHHLVLDRWAIARADALDLTTVKRRTIKPATDDLMRALARMRDPAAHLGRMVRTRSHKREQRCGIVARLLFEPRVVDRAAIDAWRRAGLQTIHRNGQFAHALGEALCRRVACTPTGMICHANMDLAGQESPCGQDDCRRVEAQTRLRLDSPHPPALDQQIIDGLLEQEQVRLRFDN